MEIRVVGLTQFHFHNFKGPNHVTCIMVKKEKSKKKKQQKNHMFSYILNINTNYLFSHWLRAYN